MYFLPGGVGLKTSSLRLACTVKFACLVEQVKSAEDYHVMMRSITFFWRSGLRSW